MFLNSSIASAPHEATLDRPIDGVHYRVTFEQQPFDKGACRLAFMGAYSGNGRKNGEKCVTKIFIEEAARHYNSYKPDQLASLKANELAQSFNANFSSTKPLRFVVPEIATVVQVDQRSQQVMNMFVKPGDKILVEDYIEGSYEKFNNNFGWHRDEVAAIPAFSHYTYWQSDGKFLVCDIQGVRSTNGYTLTDPAVHSRVQGQFGPTDLGPAGMARFFEYHKCTSICSQLSKPTFNANRMINRGRVDRKASTYTFMLDANEVEANDYFRQHSDLPAIRE